MLKKSTTTTVPYAGSAFCRRQLFEEHDRQTWRQRAVPYHRRYEAPLINLAINRLAHGDVSHTQYGIRVQVRPDLRDDRSATQSSAYWPEAFGGCRCWSMKTRGACSHTLAAEMYRDSIAVEDAR